MSDPRDTAPQPPPCCDPSAPVVKCCVCGTDVHTCERTEPVDNDYRCPAHVNGVEMSAGEWVCSDACGYERILAANWKRIAALEAQLAEAQERLAMVVEALNGTLGELQAVQATCALSGLPAKAWAGFGGKAKKALDATADSVAQHTAEVEARAIQKCQRCVTPQQLAEIMHDVYEKESRAAGWNTQEACHVPFGELPEANKRVMLQVARAVLWATPDLAEMEVRLKCRPGAVLAVVHRFRPTSRSIDGGEN